MKNSDYYIAHGVHPNLWQGIQGAWLPSLGNTGGWVPDQVGNGIGSVRGIAGTQNNHWWTTNSSTRAGRQIVAQGNGSNSYWYAPFRLGRVRQATISLWAGARGVVFGSPSASASNRYIFSWVDPTTWNTTWGMSQNNSNGAMWLDGAWRGSQTTWSQSLQHYALVWGPGRLLTVYVNGSSIHSHTMAGSAPSVPTDPTVVALGIGSGGVGACAWDDLRTYNRALSLNEIKALAERPGIAYDVTPRRMGYVAAAAPTSSNFTFRRAFSRVLP